MTTQRVQEYLVLPTGCTDDGVDWDMFVIRVISTGAGRWKVMHRMWVLDINGTDWDTESLPSERTDEWLNQHRFPTAEAALAAAHSIADTIKIMGRTWDQYATWVADSTGS